MKLKKIASLALAGIMAVSMLAGCKYGEGSSSSSSSSEVTTTPATGIAAAVNDVRGSYAKDILKLSYTEDTDLTEILQNAAEDAFGKNTTVIKNNSGFKTAVALDTGAWVNLYQDVADQLVGTVSYTTALTSVSAAGTSKYMKLYLVGGDYTLASVGNQINDMSTNGLEALTSNMELNAALGVTYTADVAAVKIVSPDDADINMWVVAVVYTRTAV